MTSIPDGRVLFHNDEKWEPRKENSLNIAATLKNW